MAIHVKAWALRDEHWRKTQESHNVVPIDEHGKSICVALSLAIYILAANLRFGVRVRVLVRQPLWSTLAIIALGVTRLQVTNPTRTASNQKAPERIRSITAPERMDPAVQEKSRKAAHKTPLSRDHVAVSSVVRFSSTGWPPK